MTRRRRKSRKQRLGSLTTLEKNIAYLHLRKFPEDSEQEQARQSLIRQFITKDQLTPKQQSYVKTLARSMRRMEKLDEMKRLNEAKTAKELSWL